MISFKQSDLDELRNSCTYLSGVFLEFYFTYLSATHHSDLILFVQPTISFLLANVEDKKDVADCLKPLELHTKELVFFPVNNGGIHWSLLVYNRDLNVFAHHDSLGGLNNEEAEGLYLAVRDCVQRKGFRFRMEFLNKRRQMDDEQSVPVYRKVTTPRQKNGYDCGLYVMAMAKAICGWFCSAVREETWLSEIEKIDDSVGTTLRPFVLQLIREASEGRLGSVSCTIEEESRDGKGRLGSVSCTIEEESRDGKSEGRLGSVSCCIEEESRDGKSEELTQDEIEVCQYWAGFDDPVDSETTISPSTTRTAVLVGNDSPSLAEEEANDGKITLIKEEAVSDSDQAPRFPSCDSTSAQSSIVAEDETAKDVENILDTATLSDCRTSVFSREYLTSWPPEEGSTVD